MNRLQRLIAYLKFGAVKLELKNGTKKVCTMCEEITNQKVPDAIEEKTQLTAFSITTNTEGSIVVIDSFKFMPADVVNFTMTKVGDCVYLDAHKCD